MKTKYILSFFFLALFSIAAMSQNTNESSQPGGDFPNTGSGPLINLLNGSNSVLGTIQTPFDGQDRFQVVVPNGLELTAVSFNFSQVSGSSGNMTFNSAQVINSPSGTVMGTPYAAGTYSILISSNFSVGSNWSMTFTVNSVATATEDASFSYSASGYCTNETNPTPTITGTPGGTFTSSTGISLNLTTGAVNLTGSVPGTYNINYTTSGSTGTAASSNVMLSINTVDNASFSYSGPTYCQNASDPTPTITGLAGGTFSSTAGLSINASTGSVDLSASTPGTYLITYTTAASCPNSTSVSVTINALDNASFSYSASTYCANGSDPTPTISGLAGGTFSSTAGLSMNASTGNIDVSASTHGTYMVTYTTGACPNSSSVSVTISTLDDASFSYNATTFCPNETNPTPTITGLAGGTFTSTAGLSFNATTGSVDLSASTQGTYIITYTTSGACLNSSTFSMTIIDNAAPSPDVAILADVQAECNVTILTPPTATDNCNGTVTVTNDAMLPITTQGTTVVTWTYDDGNGNTSTQLQNIVLNDTTPPVITLPTNISVVNDLGNCDAVVTYNVSSTDNCSTSQEMLSTTFAAGNSQNGNMFDITSNANAITITSFEQSVQAVGAIDMELYYKSGSYVGSENTPSAWTLLGTVTVTTVNSTGSEVINVPIGGLNIPANSTYGLYITTSNGVNVNYTNGSNTYNNTDVTINTGVGNAYPFDATFSPRTWNGAINYEVSAGGSLITIVQDAGLASGLAFPVGTTTNTFTATDTAGNSTTQSFDITVSDNEAPVPDITMLVDVVFECDVTSLTAPTATDNCATTITVTNDAVFPISGDGTTTIVTWTFDDGNGNISTQTQNVILDDVTAPEITALNHAVIINNSGNATFTTAEVATATDNCSTSNINATPLTISCVNVSSIGNVVRDAAQSGANSSGGAGIGNAQTFLAQNTGLLESVELDFRNFGATVVQGTVEVLKNNQANTGVEILTMQTFDIQPGVNRVLVTFSTPTLLEQGELYAYRLVNTGATRRWNNSNTPYTDGTTYDGVGTIPTGNGNGLDWYFVTNVRQVTGTPQEVTVTATDLSGNVSTSIVYVFATDNIAPTGDVAMLADVTSECEVTSLTTPTASDNCSNATVTVTNDAMLPITTQGTTVVTWSYDDGNGNISTQTQNVIIDDVTPPTFTVTSATGTMSNPFTSVDKAALTSVPSGIYFFNFNNTTFQGVLDNDTNGGGWLMVLNYVHQQNTNPDLVIRNTDLPLMGSSVLGDNEAATATWGHMGNALAQAINFDEIRFYGQTSGHNRIIDFSTNLTTAIDYVKNGTGSFNGINNASNYTLSTAHTSSIPQNAPNFFANEGDFALTNFPFWRSGQAHWGIKGFGNRWEVDDFPNNSSLNTIHRVWVRASTTPFSDSITVQLDATGNASIATTDFNINSTDNCSAVTSSLSQSTFNCSNLGDNIIQYTIADANGNNTIVFVNVSFQDVTAPVADLATLVDVTAECEVTSLVAPTATDSCSGTATVTNNAMLPISGEGTTTVVTWSYDDGNGNISTQTQNVIIDDVTAPTPDATTLAGITAECEVTSLTAPTATDNCSNATVTVTNDAMLPISGEGTTTVVTWSYDDGNGNISTQTQNVIIDDVTAPTPDVAVLADITAECEITSLTAPTATDNCSNATVTVTSNAMLPITAQGTTVVTWSYDDGNGNVSTQTQNVILDDVTAPVLNAATLPDLVFNCVVTSLTPPTASDNCVGTVTGTATFPINTTRVVMWSFDDGNGNVTTQSQLVIIERRAIDAIANATACDTFTLPTITGDYLTGSQQYYTQPGGNGNAFAEATTLNFADFANYPVTLYAYDTDGAGCSAETSFTLTINATPVIDPIAAVTACNQYVLPALPVGNYFTFPGGNGTMVAAGFVITATQTLFVYAANGNCTDQESFTVTIQPLDNPTFNYSAATYCPNDTDPTPTVTGLAGGTFTSTTGLAINATTGAIDLDASILGSYVVTYTTNGNCPQSSTVNVTIEDNDAPVPALAVLATVTAQCEVTSLVAPTATDNCGGTVTVTSDAIFPITGEETTTVVTWIYADANGNTATQTQNVIIDDTTAPVATVAALPSLTFNCSVSALTAPTAIDNCEGPITAVTGTAFPINATKTVTWTYDDGNGNVSTQTQLIVIERLAINAIANATQCDSFTLPTITGNFLTGAQQYYTMPGGNGTAFAEAITLNFADFATYPVTLYAYDTNSAGCSAERSFTLTINATPVIAPIAAVTACDQYMLPALPVGNYFTFPGGNGALISAGSVITANQTLFVYAQDPSGNCSNQESFVINITPSDINGATFSNASFTFNGTAQSIFVQNIPSAATVVYTNNGQTNAGTYVVTATITSANATCNIVIRTATMTIGRAAQTITFDPLTRRRLFVDPDFQINASASSGLPLTYTFSFTGTNPAATVSATGFVTLLEQGEILITASQPGNGNYLPAQQVQRRLEVYLGDNADLDAITIGGDVINNPDSEIYYLIDCDDSADFVDVELTNNDSATFNPGATFTINTPRPGIYTQQVIVTAENGIVTRTYNITVERRFQFDAIVEQKYNNVLVVNNNPANNGGYSFVAYEWFKNGTRVGTQQFFSEGDNATDLLDPTALYYVRMTTTTGEVLQTCVSTVSLGNTFSLTVLENPVISGRKLNVRADYPTSELDNARYELYSASGQYLYAVRVDGVDTAIELSESLPVGMYRLVLITQARSQSVNFIKN